MHRHSASKTRVNALMALHRIRETSVWVSGNYRITFRVDGEDVNDIDFEDYHGK